MDGKIVIEKESVCYVRDYRITKHFHGFPPEFKVLDAPVYRVSQGGTLMSHMDFDDLDTAVECAVGYVIKDKMQSVQAKLNETMAGIHEQVKQETLQIDRRGHLTYPVQT